MRWLRHLPDLASSTPGARSRGPDLEVIMISRAICVLLIGTAVGVCASSVSAQSAQHALGPRPGLHPHDLPPPTVWYVDISAPSCSTGTGGPSDPFCQVTDAIAAAADGDTIHIAPGTYVESLVLDKDLTLIGTEESVLTILDGSLGTGSTVEVLPGTRVHLEGLTLTHGVRGITAEDCELTLLDVTVSGNVANDGGGISALRTSLTLIRSAVVENTSWDESAAYATSRGGGIFATDSALTLLDSTVCDNYAGPCFFVLGSPYGLGGGIYAQGGTLVVRRCTIARNVADSCDGPAGGHGIWTESGSITDTVIWGKWGGTQIVGPVTATCSDVEGGWPGTGNIDADPLFVDPASGDYRLQSGSPCIDAGNPIAMPTGLDLWGGPRCLDGDLDGVMAVDMGAHEFGNVHLAVTGGATPTGTLDIDVTGTLGLPVLLLAGFAPGEVCLSHYGPLFFDPLQPWSLWSLGTLPSSVSVPLGPSFPTPIEVVPQALALSPAVPAGNTSNPVTLRIE
jgi:hypothetical protein